MMPPVEIAARTALEPVGVEAVCGVEVARWKLANDSTRIVSSGTAIFHQVIALLVVASMLDTEEVDRGQDRHQDHGDDDAGRA